MNKVTVAVPDRPDTRVIRLYFTRLAWRWGYFDVHRGAISIRQACSGVDGSIAERLLQGDVLGQYGDHRYAPHR